MSAPEDTSKHLATLIGGSIEQVVETNTLALTLTSVQIANLQDIILVASESATSFKRLHAGHNCEAESQAAKMLQDCTALTEVIDAAVSQKLREILHQQAIDKLKSYFSGKQSR